MKIVNLNELILIYYDKNNENILEEKVGIHKLNVQILKEMKVCLPIDQEMKDYFVEQYRELNDNNVYLNLENIHKKLSLAFESKNKINVFPLILDKSYKFGMEEMKGIMGYTILNNIFIVMNISEKTNLDILENIFIHEYCHAFRNTFINNEIYKRDLLFYIVEEGLAEYYVKEMKGIESVGPWAKKVDSISLKENINFFKENANHSDVNLIKKILFGSIEIGCPHWFGYSFGYKLIEYFVLYKGINFTHLITQDIQFFKKNININEIEDFLSYI